MGVYSRGDCPVRCSDVLPIWFPLWPKTSLELLSQQACQSCLYHKDSHFTPDIPPSPILDLLGLCVRFHLEKGFVGKSSLNTSGLDDV